MKNLTKYIVAFIIIALPIFAAEDQKVETSAKDSFINLVLEKAKLYSDKAESAISKSVDVVMEQAPIIVKEYLEWNFFKAAVDTFLYGCISIIFIVLGGVIMKKMKGEGFEYIVGSIFCVIAIIIISTLLKDSSMEMIKIKVAPRVYLIESTYDYVKSDGKAKNRR